MNFCLLEITTSRAPVECYEKPDARIRNVARLSKVSDAEQIELLSPIAKQGWNRLELEFPVWKKHLKVRDGELEFAIPAPDNSMAGHLTACSDHNQLWLRFSPPYMCYPVDDQEELIFLIRELTADRVLFRIVTKGEDWVETTLVRREDKCEPISGHRIRLASWSGKYDASY